jgi:tRNA-modifying protein YgfZ
MGNEPRPGGADAGMDTAPPPAGAPEAPPAPPSPLLAVPGAVAGEGLDAGVAWHYGDPTREQRLLERGEAVVDLSQRGVLRLTGGSCSTR